MCKYTGFGIRVYQNNRTASSLGRLGAVGSNGAAMHGTMCLVPVMYTVQDILEFKTVESGT